MTRLAAVVLTYNEQKHIAACLASLAFAEVRLVFDSHSTDATRAIAEQLGVRVLERHFDHYAGQRNAALAAVAGQAEWVLFVDADERITPELAAEIRAAMQQDSYVAYRIPRHNYIFGKLTRGAGWYPDYQTRLWRLGRAHYDPERLVHEVVLVDGAIGTLEQAIVHYNYEDVAQFQRKQRKYTAYEAQILFQEGQRPKLQNYVLQPLRHFVWRYITLKGYQDGWHGLRLSLWMAWYEGQKYHLLRHLWQIQAGASPEATPPPSA